MSATWQIKQGDVLDRLREMPDESVHCCATSPPYYGLRDYQVDGQIGLEESPDEFVAKLVEVFAEVRRVLRADGTLWLNLGDSYALKASRGVKPKDLYGLPWTVAFALRADGWFLRRDIVWSKPDPKPEKVLDRPTTSHEYVFLLSKSGRYFYDAQAVREEGKDWSRRGPGTGILTTEHYGAGNGGNAGLARLAQRYKDGTAPAGRNRRSVWEVATQPYPGAHFAVWPEKLVEPMVLAGCPFGGTVLDPFAGSGTTLKVAVERGRDAIGIELNEEYVKLAERRLAGVTPPLFAEAA